LKGYRTRRDGPVKAIMCLICGGNIGSYTARFYRPPALDLAVAEHGERYLPAAAPTGGV
jgi:hypothetical protein